MDVLMIGSRSAIFIFLIWIFNCIYVLKEWERGVVLRLGRMMPDGQRRGPAAWFSTPSIS